MKQILQNLKTGITELAEVPCPGAGRGRIMLVGVTGLELSRDDFFKKELTFQVSSSYGPGRYDVNYEEKGQDYPVGYVRWTEQRNFEAVLDMMATDRLDVKPLISHRFSIDEAKKAYEIVGGAEHSLGILLEYNPVVVSQRSVALRPAIARKMLRIRVCLSWKRSVWPACRMGHFFISVTF